jgi:hypothetical protein
VKGSYAITLRDEPDGDDRRYIGALLASQLACVHVQLRRAWALLSHLSDADPVGRSAPG